MKDFYKLKENAATRTKIPAPVLGHNFKIQAIVQQREQREMRATTTVHTSFPDIDDDYDYSLWENWQAYRY